jgi:hypothetical protein
VHDFSRLRRAEIIHHHIAGAYLLRYAQEPWWREDNRKVSNGDQVNDVGLLDHSQRHTDSSSIVRTRVQITNSLVVSRKETMAPNVNSSSLGSAISTDPPARFARMEAAYVASPRDRGSRTKVPLWSCNLSL